MRYLAGFALVLIVLILASGCGPESAKDFSWEVMVIDNCEYIAYVSAYGATEITHKGDCDNPIHGGR